MNYIKITKHDIANGSGVRVVLWVSGCSLHCKGCQNPSTWDVSTGQLFDETAKNELFKALNKPYVQGLTLSGGHPLEAQNLDEVYNIVSEVRKIFPEKDIWLYTGLTWENAIQDPRRFQILQMCDVVVDGSFIEWQKNISLKFRGSSNQRLIDVKRTLQENKIITLEE